MADNRVNYTIGWLIAALAFTVYFLTLAPTASFWDCGEFIAAAYKVQVGHPPGAPLFVLLGRLFSLGAAPADVAWRINLLSAFASAFTAAFLYWTIVRLAQRTLSLHLPLSRLQQGSLIAAGATGALVFTFSDTFWFSAVEAEVYALSLFFTAVLFWAIVRWEAEAEQPGAARWLLFIAFLLGLSIGVHQLNLLAIPAILLVVFFRKFRVTPFSTALAMLISAIALWLVQTVLIPGGLALLVNWEIFVVNEWGWPFQSGVQVALSVTSVSLLLATGYSYLLMWKRIHLILLGLSLAFLGASSYTTVYLRSAANPTMDEGNPENVLTFEQYFNRDQYGKNPLWYGPHFNSPHDPDEPFLAGDTSYYPDVNTQRYRVADNGFNKKLKFHDEFQQFFPRMHSQARRHRLSYLEFSGFQGDTLSYLKDGVETEVVQPTQSENLRFFLNYQMGWMYARYFFWNFSGRQNDIQGHGGILYGNWVTGIDWIDELRLGATKQQSPATIANKGFNRFFGLPFILGVIGFFFHFKQNKSGFWSTLWLFLFTGIAIVIFLNQTPLQPRERDYAFVGSFYTFSIWIGLGALSIIQGLSKWISHRRALPVTLVVSALLLPSWMAFEGWNDHNRSNLSSASDFAYNYLNSCAPNAILFTVGDNDTFPLWYLQQVEGIRTDVRVINLSLLNIDWYIDQLKQPTDQAAVLPISLSSDDYRAGTRDYLYTVDSSPDGGYKDLQGIIQEVRKEEWQMNQENGHVVYLLPATLLSIPIPANLAPSQFQLQENLDSVITWKLPNEVIFKKDLLLLDIIAQNQWKRPIYFVAESGKKAHLGLTPFLRSEGLVDRLVPARNKDQGNWVHTQKLTQSLLHDFKWGGLANCDSLYFEASNPPTGEDLAGLFPFQVKQGNTGTHGKTDGKWLVKSPKPAYANQTVRQMAKSLLTNFILAASGQLIAGDTNQALKLLDKSWDVLPRETLPQAHDRISIAQLYCQAKASEKATQVMAWIAEQRNADLKHYLDKSPFYQNLVFNQIDQALEDLKQLQKLSEKHLPGSDLSSQIKEDLKHWQALILPSGQAHESR